MSIAEKFEVITDEVYKKGKSDNEIEIWDYIQNHGNRQNYDGAFRNWGGEYIRPPKNKVIVKEGHSTYGAQYIFAGSSTLKKIEAKYFDFSELDMPTNDANNMLRQLFQNCTNLEEIEDVGLPPARYYYVFSGCENLHTIAVLRFAEDTEATQTFNRCSKLQNISIEGTIGKSISFGSSPLLTLESLKSIITHLKKYSADDDGYGKYALTLHEDSKNLLEEQGAIEEFDNREYEAYITDIGWNLE